LGKINKKKKNKQKKYVVVEEDEDDEDEDEDEEERRPVIYDARWVSKRPMLFTRMREVVLCKAQEGVHEMCHTPLGAWTTIWCDHFQRTFPKLAGKCNRTHLPCVATRLMSAPPQFTEIRCPSGRQCSVTSNSLAGMADADAIILATTMWQTVENSKTHKLFKAESDAEHFWRQALTFRLHHKPLLASDDTGENSFYYPHGESVHYWKHFGVRFGMDMRFSNVFAHPYLAPMKGFYDQLVAGTPPAGLVRDFSVKRKFLVYIQSHCVNERDKLVHELMRELPPGSVHALGRCLHNEAAKLNGRHNFKRIQQLDGVFDFVLAIENKQCPWYVTEKLLTPLRASAIPVYLGGGNEHEYLPTVAPARSIVSIREYPTVHLLAKHLLYLYNNRTAYAEYMQWRSDPSMIIQSPGYQLANNNHAVSQMAMLQ
jgi:Glycosyltransferase family 10 (fucosyltransferase) C-term